jgi:hypothetical protein
MAFARPAGSPLDCAHRVRLSTPDRRSFVMPPTGRNKRTSRKRPRILASTELPPNDNDPNVDWEVEGGATIVDAAPVTELDPETAPHRLDRLPGYEIGLRAGREQKARACYEEGQEDIFGALRSVLIERGLTNDEAAHLLLLVRGRSTPL